MKTTDFMHTLNASIWEVEAGGLIKESSAIKQLEPSLSYMRLNLKKKEKRRRTRRTQ